MKLPEGLSFEELYKIYEEELSRKDRLIDRLREENEILMKTALHRADTRIKRDP